MEKGSGGGGVGGYSWLNMVTITFFNAFQMLSKINLTGIIKIFMAQLKV